MTGLVMVTTTVATADDAKAMARTLVAGKLAACVQILPLASVYAWKGAIEESAEWMLLCKTRSDDYVEIEAAILRLHAYDTPEIVMVPVVGGFQPYLDWIAESTTR